MDSKWLHYPLSLSAIHSAIHNENLLRQFGADDVLVVKAADRHAQAQRPVERRARNRAGNTRV